MVTSSTGLFKWFRQFNANGYLIDLFRLVEELRLRGNENSAPAAPLTPTQLPVSLRAARWNNATSSVTYHFPAASEMDLSAPRKQDAFALPGHTAGKADKPPLNPSSSRPVSARAPSPAPPSAAHKTVPSPSKGSRRRSKSAEHEVWLDHRPANVQPLETLFQTRMRKRISTSKLKVADTQEASKYVLTHQQATSQGGMETQLFKGDVLPSMTGGTRVVLNEVETLRTSPPVSDR